MSGIMMSTRRRGTPTPTVAPTYQATGTAQAGQGFDIGGAEPQNIPWEVTVGWPTHIADDVAILKLYGSTATSAILTGSGWNAISATSHSTASLSTWWKRATSSSEASVVLSENDVTTNQHNCYAVITTYRGCVATGSPINVINSSTRTASTSCTFPTVTTTLPFCKILLVASRDNDNAAAAWSAQTNATLSSIAERHDAGTALGDGGGLSLTDATMTSAGATGTTSSTVTSSAGCMQTIALIGT